MQLNKTKSQTIEHVLFERMGVSVEDAFATGADLVDEQVSKASESGVDIESRLGGLLEILLKLTEPKTMVALNSLVDRLPQLAELTKLTKLTKLAEEVPNLLATVGDVLDDYQQRCAQAGIDMEKSLANGLHAALWLGSHVEKDDLARLEKLLKSDILSHNSISVLGNAANSLSSAQQNACESKAPGRVAMFGLVGLLRNPDIQKSIAFAAKFGECFGRNLDQK